MASEFLRVDPDPNVFPGNWTVRTQQLLKTYELAFTQNWNPSEFKWDELEGKNFDREHAVAQAYWMTKLSLFEKSGIGAFGFATVQAAKYNLEDPTKKFLAAVTFDECRHDEVCRRACSKLCPNFPYRFKPESDLERKAIRNIDALYENGKRYWRGFEKAWGKYSLELIFSGFFFAEIGAQLIFKEVADRSKLDVYRSAFTDITRDESRHLSGTLSLLENMAAGMTNEQKQHISRQMKHGFIFLSPLLFRPMREFWELPADFDEVDGKLEELAREGGLGVPTVQEKSEDWVKAVDRQRPHFERVGVPVPAIPEIGLDGVEVKVRKDEPIATPL